jgi:hypothetical protein
MIAATASANAELAKSVPDSVLRRWEMSGFAGVFAACSSPAGVIFLLL